MNAQIRYGLAALLCTVLFWLIAVASGGDAFLLAGTLCLFAGVFLLIVGLIRKPRSASQQPPQG